MNPGVARPNTGRIGTDTRIAREVTANQLQAPKKSCALNPNPEAEKVLSYVYVSRVIEAGSQGAVCEHFGLEPRAQARGQ